jgi:branched-chain amino acid transport system permease protein
VFNWLLLLEAVIGGLLSGVMYALVALGFVLIYKASGVFNFAQGSLVLFAALTFVLLLEFGDTGAFWNWAGWLALVLAAVAGAVYLDSRLARRFVTAAAGKAVMLAAAAAAVVALALLFGGERSLWRAAFVVLLVFLVLGLGVDSPRAAAAVLLGLAAAALLPGGLFPGAGWNFWRSLAVTLAMMILLAIAVERVVLRPLVNQAPIILFMATIGLNFLLEGVAQGVWDADVHALDVGIPDTPLQGLSEATGVFVSTFDLVAAAVAGLLVLTLAVFFQKTRVGRALRAVADDHQAASATGIALHNIWAIVWSVAGIVALVAGLLWGARLGVQFSLSLIVLKALPVLILGGFTSVPGAIVGGLIVGVTEKTFEVFVGIPHLGGGTESWSPYMLAMVFLLFRPQGLFGERIIERV